MFTIEAEVRKRAGVRVRAAACVTLTSFPAIVYGGEAAPVAIELDHDKVWKPAEQT